MSCPLTNVAHVMQYAISSAKIARRQTLPEPQLDQIASTTNWATIGANATPARIGESNLNLGSENDTKLMNKKQAAGGTALTATIDSTTIIQRRQRVVVNLKVSAIVCHYAFPLRGVTKTGSVPDANKSRATRD